MNHPRETYGFLCFALSTFVLATGAIAQVPAELSYQGYLTDSGGTPITGSVKIDLTLHADASCTSQQWSRTYTGVPINEGTFDVSISAGTPDISVLPLNEPLWLHVEVEDQEVGCTSLAASPYALGMRQFTITPETSTDGPNIIGGAYNNFADTGVVGAVIAGGGDPDDATCQPNRVLANYAAVVGGIGNGAEGYQSFVGSGSCNTASGAKAVVAGGSLNEADGDDAVVAGGANNDADGIYAAIGGGTANAAWSEAAAIAGGDGNDVSADFGAIGGGRRNRVEAALGTIAGGGADPDNVLAEGNVVYNEGGTIGGGGANVVGGTSNQGEEADYGVIGGGFDNLVHDAYGMVGGGYGNVAGYDLTTEWASTVAGGGNNLALGAYSFIGGGRDNQAVGYGVVGGGKENVASNEHATVGGGESNSAGSHATVAGGKDNSATLSYASVGGGLNNTAGQLYAAVGGGRDNTASAQSATIGGGSTNQVSADYGTIGGGGPSVPSNAETSSNKVFSSYGTVGGGGGNWAGDELSPTNGRWSTVGGGFENRAVGLSSVVAGGNENQATEAGASVLGGYRNYAYGSSSTVAGGQDNIAGASDILRLGPAVLGGYYNEASGDYATIPGGYENLASGAYTFAAGWRAQAVNFGSFVWNDRSVTGEGEYFTSTAANQFLVRAAGGVGINTNSPANAFHVVRNVSASASVQNHVAVIDNTSTGTGADVLALRVGRSTNPESTNAFISFKYNGNSSAGFINGNGAGGVNYTSSGADYAEYLPHVNPDERLEPGEVVGIFGGRVSKVTVKADQVMVVSTAPIVLGNQPLSEEGEAAYAKISFIGQAPVKVNGKVKIGDFLLPSGHNDGSAIAIDPSRIRVDQIEQIFATAWESKNSSGFGLINAAIGIDQQAASAKAIEALQNQVVSLAARLDELEAHIVN